MSEVPDRGVEIDDPDNFSSRQRLKQIYQARRDLREMRTEAAAHRRTNALRALSFYRTGVEGYLMELDTLMRQHEPGPELLYGTDFGTVRIQVPGSWEQRHGYYVNPDLGEKNKTLKVQSLPEPKTVPLKGLSTLIELPSPIKQTFEIRRMNELAGGSVVELTGTGRIEWETLNRMVTAMNEFVSELGLGLDVDKEDEWKI